MTVKKFLGYSILVLVNVWNIYALVFLMDWPYQFVLLGAIAVALGFLFLTAYLIADDE